MKSAIFMYDASTIGKRERLTFARKGLSCLAALA